MDRDGDACHEREKLARGVMEIGNEGDKPLLFLMEVLVIRGIALDRDIILPIQKADLEDRPLHQKLAAVFAVVEGLTHKDLACQQTLVEMIEHLAVGARSLQQFRILAMDLVLCVASQSREGFVGIDRARVIWIKDSDQDTQRQMADGAI